MKKKAEQLLEKLEIIYYGQFGLDDKDKYRGQCTESVLQAFKEVAEDAFMSNPSYDSIDDFEDYWNQITKT